MTSNLKLIDHDEITNYKNMQSEVSRMREIALQLTVFGLSADVVTILSITGAISNALKLSFT